MIYSKECKYAIRAATHLAQRPNQRCLVKEIAVEEGLPQFFLSKILQSLAREKLLISVKGVVSQELGVPDKVCCYELS